MAVITIAQAKIPNWIGTGTGTYYLFLAPNKSIIADSEEVQGSPALEKAAWYIQVECTVANEVDARGLTVPTLTIPSVKLHSTSDADDPTFKWQMKIARFLSDKATHSILGMFSFRLPAAPTSTTWQAIRTYNLAAAEVEDADHLDTYLDEYTADIVARLEALEEGGAGGSGETLLSTTPLFNLAIDTWQDLYTCPVGKICFPTMTIVTDSTTDLAESEVGAFECRESSSTSDIRIEGSLSSLIAAADYIAFRADSNRSKRVAAGNKVQGRVGAAHTGGAATVKILLFGVLIDA